MNLFREKETVAENVIRLMIEADDKIILADNKALIRLNGKNWRKAKEKIRKADNTLRDAIICMQEAAKEEKRVRA